MEDYRSIQRKILRTRELELSLVVYMGGKDEFDKEAIVDWVSQSGSHHIFLNHIGCLQLKSPINKRKVNITDRTKLSIVRMFDRMHRILYEPDPEKSIFYEEDDGIHIYTEEEDARMIYAGAEGNLIGLQPICRVKVDETRFTKGVIVYLNSSEDPVIIDLDDFDVIHQALKTISIFNSTQLLVNLFYIYQDKLSRDLVITRTRERKQGLFPRSRVMEKPNDESVHESASGNLPIEKKEDDFGLKGDDASNDFYSRL